MEVYHIPANFTDAGKIFGFFEIRNVIEAVVLTVPIIFLLMAVLPFALNINIMLMIVIVIPVGGFALIGIGDDCLTRYIRIWWQYRKRRKIIAYRGTIK